MSSPPRTPSSRSPRASPTSTTASPATRAFATITIATAPSKVRKLERVNLALAGHEEPIHDFRRRVDEIATFHRERLLKVRQICAEPRTIAEVAQAMFGAQDGYGSILAIEEAGAHVEYLHALGKLAIANLDEVSKARDPVFRYIHR